MIRRMNSSAVNADAESKRIRGVGAVYYNGTPETEFEMWPGGVERILPGAFDRAAKEDNVVGLFNHDASHVLGRTSSGTMRLTVTERGLEYEIDPADTTISADVREHIKRGDVEGSSFAFSIPMGGQTWSKEDRDGKQIEVRNITDVKLYDTGPVTYPAYAATEADVREARSARDESHGIDPSDSELDDEQETPPEAMDQDVLDNMPRNRARVAAIGIEILDLTSKIG